jgi:hypothetical protein
VARTARDRRLLAGTACVEAVAVVAVLSHGSLALVAVAVLYWIDLSALTLRTAIQQLLSRPTTDREPTGFPRPFRLLAHKRGSIAVTDRLPGLYLRNVPVASGAVFVVALSVVTTGYVAAVDVPGALWTAPATPFVLGGGLVAATAKSWLALTAHVAAGAHEHTPASAITPRKRLLVFAVYGAVLWLVSGWTRATVSQAGPAAARAGMTAVASVLILSRCAYGWYASRARPDERASSPDRSVTVPEEDTPVSRPDRGAVRETMTPVRASVLAAGVVNAATTGGVVDGRIGHWRQLTIRLGTVGAAVVAVFALADGAVVVAVALAAVAVGVLGALSAASVVHMLLALGGVEYRFHDDGVVAYDRRLGRPQWSASCDRVRNVSVERGLFGSPLWLDAGTVRFDRAPEPGSDGATRPRRSSVAFVSDPERARELLRSPGEP